MSGKEIGSYVIKDKLNKGGTSLTYRAENPEGTLICKITDGKFCDTVSKEFEILRQLEHQSIVKVFDCISCNKIVAMSMEYLPGGDLHDLIIHRWPIFPDDRRKFAFELLSAVQAIHQHGIAHCDLKLENILINEHGDLKIIDFGSALKVEEATFDDFAYIATTPEYLPPEIICACADESYDIRAIDEWSVGVILFILLTGRFPFGEVDQNRIAKYIKKMKTSTSFELRPKEENLLYIESDYLDMVRVLLCFKDHDRYPVSKVLQMPYFTGDKSISAIEDEIDRDFEDIFDEFLTF